MGKRRPELDGDEFEITRSAAALIMIGVFIADYIIVPVKKLWRALVRIYENTDFSGHRS